MDGKCRMKEFLESIGQAQELCAFLPRQTGLSGGWHVVATLFLPNRPPLSAEGAGNRLSDAEADAATQILEELDQEVLMAVVGPRLQREAQAGDALLKLAGYLGAASPEAGSLWLQGRESNAALASVYDAWVAGGDPDLQLYGGALGVVRKATIVEALIWRRYRSRILSTGAADALAELRSVVGEPVPASPVELLP